MCTAAVRNGSLVPRPSYTTADGLHHRYAYIANAYQAGDETNGMATRCSDGGGDDTQSGSQLQSQEVILAEMASFMESLKEFKNEMVEQQEEVEWNFV